MIIEAIFTAIFIARPSAWLAIILLGLTLFRRWPWLANAIAHRLELDTYDGMTAYAARIALPAWSRYVKRGGAGGDDRSTRYGWYCRYQRDPLARS